MYEVFAKLLDEKDVKAADVCRATGLPSSLFSEWKRGKSTPKFDKLKKIADYFEVPVEYLITGEMPEPPTLEEELAEFVADLIKEKDDSFKKRYVSMLAKLDVEGWEILEKVAISLGQIKKAED